MDTKNSDDSAGSDSLDKSLQKKCVVEDVGQGEGSEVTAPATTTAERPGNSTKKQKTDKSVGDGASDNGTTAATTLTAQKASTHAEEAQIPSNTAATSAATSNSTATPPPNSNKKNTNNNNNAFETKVKQISQNLKETTLATAAGIAAAPAPAAQTVDSLVALEDVGSDCSSDSSSASQECEQPTPSCSKQKPTTTASAAPQATAADAGAGVHCSKSDEQRSKKVRFHPDVKENDGGNRVAKKKKKLKASSSAAAAAASLLNDGPSCSKTAASIAAAAAFAGLDDEMDLDEEEDDDDGGGGDDATEAEAVADEEEFDLAKTIAEAQDYLKTHPLTFVRPYDKSTRLQNGLLEEEDLSQLSDSSEEEDFYDQVLPENGVERILGKQIKCGGTEYLLRYAGRPGIHWEREEVIYRQCPNMVSKYEEVRELRQDKLMRYVAKRQNIRQRYTDF